MVKVNKAFTIALATLCGAAIIPIGGAFAAADDIQETVYPQNFEQTLSFGSEIRDFAIYSDADKGDSYAFAYSTKISVLSNGKNGERECSHFTHELGIAKLDYDEKGNLYFKNDSGNVYPADSEHEFQDTERARLELSETVFYTLNSKGELTYWNGKDESPVETPTPSESGFSFMKFYGGTVYAINDNIPYKIEGSVATPLDLNYTDYSGADNIYTGEAATALKDGSYEVMTATFKGGSYCTQIDLDITGEKFTQIKTQKTDGDRPCLVLYKGEKASIFATSNGCYITSPENLTDTPYSYPENDWEANSQGERLAYSTEDVGVYSSPYVSKSTLVGTLKSGSSHPVKVIKKFSVDFYYFGATYYKVSFEDNGQTITGFVSANYLTPYNFAAEDKEPINGGDKEPVYDTNVASVILAIVIVALVIIAILYVSLITTKKDGGKKSKDKEKKKKDKPKATPDGDDIDTEE